MRLKNNPKIRLEYCSGLLEELLGCIIDGKIKGIVRTAIDRDRLECSLL